jgi:hypothetical protein
LFSKAKKSFRHGLGLVVGGKGHEQLAIALEALEKSTHENREMRGILQMLMERSAKLEERLSQFEESQKVQTSEENKQNEDDKVFQNMLFHTLM